MTQLLGQEILLIKFNNSLFVATNIPKNSDKEKFVLYSKYGITFDNPSSRGFGDNTPRNVDDNSSSNVDNLKKKKLILGLGPPYRISGSLVHQRKKLVLCLLNQIINFP